MFALEITAPEGFELKSRGVLFNLLNGLGVGDADKVRRDDFFQCLDESGLNTGVEERHVFGAFFQGPGEKEFDELLRDIHVFGNIAKGYLRFDHPELGEMPGGIGILGPEGRTKGIDP